MALSNTILKNVLKLNLMHIEKIDEEDYWAEAYGEAHLLSRIIVHARPFKRSQCHCPKCKRKCVHNGYKMPGESSWRAPNLNGQQVIIKYRPQRILCPEHGAINEFIPWADGDSRFTEPFNDEVAWLVCQTNKTAVCALEGINWRTAGNCIKASQNRLEPDIAARIHDDVRRFCVDETSYKRGYKYITVIYDMDKSRVIWIHDGHGLEVFKEFCELLTPEERAKIEIVAGDGASWIDSCMEYFPNATRCIDSFHVVQWVNSALDDVRIATAAKARREYNKLKAEYVEAEKEAAAAREKAKQEYQDALSELAAMPRLGRPSSRKLELLAFVEEYESLQTEEQDDALPKKRGRKKKEPLSPEHEASLKVYSDRVEELKRTKFALGHNPENCTDGQVDKIKMIENNYPDLYLAYQLKERLRLILHMKDAEQAAVELDQWIHDAKESGLDPMCKLAEKIETRHKQNILNSIKCQSNSARSEATNTTIKGLIAMARGFRNIDNMIALIYLKCSDIVIPLCNRPRPSKEHLAAKRERAAELRLLREEKKRQGRASA